MPHQCMFLHFQPEKGLKNVLWTWSKSSQKRDEEGLKMKEVCAGVVDPRVYQKYPGL